MSTSASDSAGLGWRFNAIDMQGLNAKAAMLERLDNKYIVPAAIVEDALVALTHSFDVLEIDGRRTFSYENCYFDGPAWESYLDHHRGKRMRSKVRMRRYLDAGLCFVEVKLKDKRGVTVKRRLPCVPASFGVLDAAAHEHVRMAYREHYGRDISYGLSRTLDTLYARTTLVAKSGGERLTIDSGLAFRAGGRVLDVDPGLFIVETKSSNGNGLADRVLRRLHQHPFRHCSKYCAGLALMQPGLKHNNFNSVLRKLGSPALGDEPRVVGEIAHDPGRSGRLKEQV